MIKIKKILAGLTAFTMLCGVSFIDNGIISEMVNTVSVSAENAFILDGIEYTVNGAETAVTLKECTDTSVTEIVIPDEVYGMPVTSIGVGAFSNCKSLTTVTIPDSVKYIYDSAFSGCESLTSVTIPDSVITIGTWVFSGTPILKNQKTDLRYIDKWLIDCNEDVTEVEIKSDTVGIADNAFCGCESLTSVTIPDSVTSIGYNAFSGCASLTSVTIPDSVIYICGRAFYSCESLTSVTIPDSVTFIGNYAFNDCTSLTEAIIGNSVTFIGDKAFYGCKSLLSVTVPESVTSIGDEALGYYYGGILTISSSRVYKFAIHGVKGSAAETYATKNKFDFVETEGSSTVTVEDIDGDGEITTSDALNVLKFVSNVSDFTDEQKKLADLDGDGEVTSYDALIVLQHIVGLE